MTIVILKGNRIRIIHTVSRALNEIFDAITQWLPLYLTGSIEPYYYPRSQDGVFSAYLIHCTADCSNCSVFCAE